MKRRGMVKEEEERADAAEGQFTLSPKSRPSVTFFLPPHTDIGRLSARGPLFARGALSWARSPLVALLGFHPHPALAWGADLSAPLCQGAGDGGGGQFQI